MAWGVLVMDERPRALVLGGVVDDPGAAGLDRVAELDRHRGRRPQVLDPVGAVAPPGALAPGAQRPAVSAVLARVGLKTGIPVVVATAAVVRPGLARTVAGTGARELAARPGDDPTSAPGARGQAFPATGYCPPRCPPACSPRTRRSPGRALRPGCAHDHAHRALQTLQLADHGPHPLARRSSSRRMRSTRSAIAPA